MFAITERLLLRPGWAEDAPALAAAIGDEAVSRNLSRVPWPYGPDDAHAFLALPAEPLRPCFLLFLRDGGALVGGIGLHGADQPELGYWIARDRWGRGLATEAGRAVVALADDSLRVTRVVASHALDNPASGRVLGKLGFSSLGEGRLHSVARNGEMAVRLLARDRPGLPATHALAA